MELTWSACALLQPQGACCLRRVRSRELDTSGTGQESISTAPPGGGLRSTNSLRSQACVHQVNVLSCSSLFEAVRIRAFLLKIATKEDELDLGDYLREWSGALEVPLSNTLGLKWEQPQREARAASIKD